MQRTIEVDHDRPAVRVIDQRLLPERFEIVELGSSEEVRGAIAEMVVRGAPLIGVTALYGFWLAAVRGEDLEEAAARLRSARPTAVNLAWAIERAQAIARSADDPTSALRRLADQVAEEDVAVCRAIGEHGVGIIEEIAARRSGEAVRILTHCNAGWLACIEHGTATAPIYEAHRRGVPLHVWVDETRPRNQGGRLTAWELAEAGVPHTVIADNAGGHLMQQGLVDMVIVGCDRLTLNGDVCNKIGTYLKALAARDNDIPFHAALPTSTIDWSGEPFEIEERSGEELRVAGLINPTSPVANPGFDVTPARLVTGIITEHGIIRPESVQTLAEKVARVA